jgi:hypothetical protein
MASNVQERIAAIIGVMEPFVSHATLVAQPHWLFSRPSACLPIGSYHPVSDTWPLSGSCSPLRHALPSHFSGVASETQWSPPSSALMLHAII